MSLDYLFKYPIVCQQQGDGHHLIDLCSGSHPG